MATGHNLDDEAARLLGNVLHWQEDCWRNKAHPARFGRWIREKGQTALPPLRAGTCRHCVLNKIEYIVDECPMA